MRTATPILFALSAVFVLAASPGWTEERARRPSLLGFRHVPAMRMPSQRQHLRPPKERSASLSNGYHCPEPG